VIKPRRLRPGDAVAVLSPSWGGPAAFPHIFDDGLAVLREDFGLVVKEYPTARMGAAQLRADPRLRARDLNDAFADDSVSGIVCSIGGDDSVRILEHLDVDLILRHPKLVMGYSDATTILGYLNLRGLVTYYGPSVMAGFSHLRCFPEALAETRRALFSGSRYAIEPFGTWADAFMDWKDVANRGKVREARTDGVGHRWINKGPASSGPVWGGCAEVLDMMNGTFAWPRDGFWDGRILALETSEDKPTPAWVGYLLRNFGVQGILSRISGLLVARPKSYSDGEKEALDAEVLKIAVGEFGRGDLNIVTNVDFGHTDPRHILPIGIELRMEPRDGTLEFAEPLFF